VPADFVELEKKNPGSQKRFPSNNGRDGKFFLWGQAVYIIAKLLGKRLRKLCQVLTRQKWRIFVLLMFFLNLNKHIGLCFEWAVGGMCVLCFGT